MASQDRRDSHLSPEHPSPSASAVERPAAQSHGATPEACEAADSSPEDTQELQLDRRPSWFQMDGARFLMLVGAITALGLWAASSPATVGLKPVSEQERGAQEGEQELELGAVDPDDPDDPGEAGEAPPAKDSRKKQGQGDPNVVGAYDDEDDEDDEALISRSVLVAAQQETDAWKERALFAEKKLAERRRDRHQALAEKDRAIAGLRGQIQRHKRQLEKERDAHRPPPKTDRDDVMDIIKHTLR